MIKPRAMPPPPVTEVKPSYELESDTKIEFDEHNPKRPGSKSHQLYEQYKSAKTVGEAE